MKLIQRLINWIKGSNEPNHPKYPRAGDIWDESEIKQLVASRDSGASWEEIGNLVDRTAAACKNKYYRL